MATARAQPKRSRGAALARIVAGLVLGLVVLEASLQLASFAVWLWPRGGAARHGPGGGHPGARVILCVGDSFTYGIGASAPDRAYPAQLEVVLRARSPDGPTWTVVNRGWPGRNSAELLQRLPALLAEERPDYVAILIGTNDTWSDAETDRPPPVRGAAASTLPDPDRWVWRLRTRRLFDLVRARLGAGPAPAPPERRPTAPRHGARGNSGQVARTRSPTARAAIPPKQQLVVELHVAAARFARDGDRAAFRETVATLEPRVLALDDPQAATLLVTVLGGALEDDAAVAAGSRALEKHGEAAGLHQALVRPLARTGRREEAWEMANRALALAPDDPNTHRALAYLENLGGRAAEAVRSTTRAFALDGDRGKLETGYRQLLPLPLEAFEDAIRDVPSLSDERRTQAVAVYRRIRSAPTASQGLAERLRWMLEWASDGGVRPILLAYPWPFPRPNEIVQTILRVAAEERAPLVDIGPVFARHLAGAPPPGDLYLPDGHFTDRGYRLVAEAVASEVLALERGAAGGARHE